jgi:hypothetical protein
MESEELWMELHVLHQHGWTVSALARHFEINRRTVNRQLEAERPRRYPDRATVVPAHRGAAGPRRAAPRDVSDVAHHRPAS